MPQPKQVRMELSPRDRLLAHSALVLNWLDDPAARLFNEWLDAIRVRENRILMEKEGTEVYRAQGGIGVIDLIRSLRDDLRQYERDVLEGKCSPLKEE